MVDNSIEQQLLAGSKDHERIAGQVMKHPDQVDELLAGLTHDKPPIKYGCGKILRMVADARPDLLYPHFKIFVQMLDHDNNIMRWEAIYVIGSLASVDQSGKITRMLDRFLEPINGPVLITAANTIGAATKIAKAKPQLADRIAEAILGVELATYKTAECRNVAIGAAIESLNEIHESIRDQGRVVRFVERQRDNTRPATRKRAERFMKRHASPAATK